MISIIGENFSLNSIEFFFIFFLNFSYIVKGNLFAPVVEAFIRNNGRYNLLESAILELFEFIKLEDIKILCTYVVENFGKIFDEIQYVQTFKNLRNKYDQHQDRLKDKEKGYES
jgi:protein phosphatase 4 regulatory subunit 3